ncbi:hypothetical protein K440DRAFT_107178 [Wilcoxina mikolae CBS 423.85]|nr:hypothetical protein K440DRAFT_107178 [Wilcoxina mikolae CBS 423.85]
MVAQPALLLPRLSLIKRHAHGPHIPSLFRTNPPTKPPAAHASSSFTMGTPQHSSHTASRAQSPSQSISPIPVNGILDPPLYVGQGFADFKVCVLSVYALCDSTKKIISPLSSSLTPARSSSKTNSPTGPFPPKFLPFPPLPPFPPPRLPGLIGSSSTREPKSPTRNE